MYKNLTQVIRIYIDRKNNTNNIITHDWKISCGGVPEDASSCVSCYLYYQHFHFYNSYLCDDKLVPSSSWSLVSGVKEY
jgi:hypothetical protein